MEKENDEKKKIISFREMDSFTKILLVLIISAIGFPFLVSLLLKCPLFSWASGAVEGWIGFWGSYLGGIFSMLGVIFTTYFLLKNQNKLHIEQLNTHKESVKSASELNDRTERERIHMTFMLKKNEEIVYYITELFDLNSKRFNSLRTCLSYSKNISVLKNNRKILLRRNLVDGRKVDDELNKIDDEINECVTKRDIELENETNIRNEILKISAQLKSTSMYFSNLESDIQAYRIKLSKSLEELYNHFEKNDIKMGVLLKKIEKHTDENLKSSNEVIGICRKNIDILYKEFIGK